MLAAEGPAFKALLLPDNSSITDDVIEQLIQYADAGMPVLIAGSLSIYPSAYNPGREEQAKALSRLRSASNIHSAKGGEMATKLQSLGIWPRVEVQANGTWYTTFRQDPEAELDYIFVRGDTIATYGSLTTNASGFPYRFDAWTGRKHPILHYTRKAEASAITIPLFLNANHTQIVAISQTRLKDVPTPDYHMTELPQAVVGYEYTKGKGVHVHVVAHSDPKPEITLNTGKVVKVDRSILSGIPPAFRLQRWDLTAEHWEAPEDPSNAAVIARKRNTTHTLTAPLVSWGKLDPQLHNASGVGYYHTQFSWPSDGRHGKAVGAYLSFTTVLNTLRVEVHGIRLDPVDLNRPQLDIGDYLRPGRNDIVDIVPTTMWNYIRSILPDISNAGDVPLVDKGVQQPIPGPSENGLVGTVTITPYQKVSIKA
jgi:hypothetical protein